MRRANLVAVTRHNRYWHVPDILDGNVRCYSKALVLRIVVGVLLEPIFDAILQEVMKSLRREILGFPVNILLTPVNSKVSAHKCPDFLPIRPRKHM